MHDFENRFGQQVLQCSRCGYCRAVCPVFGVHLRPSYNARGKMLLLKEVMEGNIELDGELVETLFQCTQCAHCVEACPSGVNVPEIIRQARKDMVQAGSCHPAFEGMRDVLNASANIYGEKDPPDLGKKRNEKADVVYFVGCVGSYREREATLATLRLLDRLNVRYTLIDEACCSGVLDDVGYQASQDLAQRNIRSIVATGAKTVITGCPYCARVFRTKQDYSELREKGIDILHLSQFLKDFDFGVTTDERVTYHDPCDLGRHCNIYEEPREIIRKIAPNFVEMAHHRADGLCCGAGGGLRGAYPKNSIMIARRRLEEVEEVGAEVLLTECNSCVHNLANAKRQRHKFKIRTIPQFLDELMESK